MRRLLRNLYVATLSRRAVLEQLRRNISSGHRRALLERFGARIGPQTRLSHPLNLINAGRDFSCLSIGDNVFLGHNVLLDLTERIEIGNDVTLSMNTVLTTHLDVGKIPLAQFYPKRSAPIRLHEDVYVGTGAIILAGVTLGPHAVVAAGAVVREDVAPFTVVGGVPARVLKTLKSTL